MYFGSGHGFCKRNWSCHSNVLQFPDSVLSEQEKFGIKAGRDQWLELDSSTDAKFSRHLILITPANSFKSNLHAGCFVEDMVGKCKAEGASDSLRQLLVNKVQTISYPWTPNAKPDPRT